MWNGDTKLYFVVPSDKFDDYHWQSYKSPNDFVSFSHSPWIDDLKNVREFDSIIEIIFVTLVTLVIS